MVQGFRLVVPEVGKAWLSVRGLLTGLLSRYFAEVTIMRKPYDVLYIHFMATEALNPVRISFFMVT